MKSKLMYSVGPALLVLYSGLVHAAIVDLDCNRCMTMYDDGEPYQSDECELVQFRIDTDNKTAEELTKGLLLKDVTVSPSIVSIVIDEPLPVSGSKQRMISTFNINREDLSISGKIKYGMIARSFTGECKFVDRGTKNAF